MSEDYSAYAPAPTSDGELARLTKLAEEQAAAEAKVADLEAQLTKAREEVRDLAEFKVPELMDQIGMSEFKTASGLKIKVVETIRAGISVANAPAAFAWLKEHNHAAMIKREIKLSFGRGEDDKANKLIERLEGEGLHPDDKASVHPSTLAAFVREKLAKGEEIPLDLLGVHRQRASKIAN